MTEILIEIPICLCNTKASSQMNIFLMLQIPILQSKMTQPKSAQKIQTNRQRLSKFLVFLQYHEVSPQQIWNSDPKLSINQFANIIEQKYGYVLSMEELLGLKSIADDEEVLHLQNFYHLGLWEGLTYETQYRKRKNFHRQNKRPHTATSFVKKFSYETYKNKAQQSGLTLNFQNRNELTKNSRFKLNQEQLQKKIVQNALDKKWDYLIKVGQMNCWIKDAQNKQLITTSQTVQPKVQKIQANKIYRIQTNQQDIKIIQQKQNGDAQILPLKVFDKKYLALKKKFVGQEKTKNNMKGTMLLVLDKKDKISKVKLGQKISQRDQQLNYLLLEIIRLKNIFQQQDQVLSECGVNM